MIFFDYISVMIEMGDPHNSSWYFFNSDVNDKLSPITLGTCTTKQALEASGL